MKKTIAITILLTALLTANVFGQADVMLNLKNYSSLFLNNRGTLDVRYVRVASEEDLEKIAALSDNPTRLDTPLEIALLSNAVGVVDIRPVEASRMLGNPREADLKLGAAVFQEIQVLRFLASNATTDASRASASNAVGRHEGILRFITDRRNVTRAEVEAFYRNGIRALISATVDEEFNKVSFLITDVIGSTSIAYNGVMTRNAQNGHYTLSYERPSVENDDKKLTAPTLEALSRAMRNSSEFSEDAINTVRAQAALIPAVRLTDRALNEIKTILTNFYTTPNANTYNALREVGTLYDIARFRSRGNAFNDDTFKTINQSYYATLYCLNEELAHKYAQDVLRQSDITALSAEQQRVLVQLR